MADCPQVQAVHSYTAKEPDELSLEESDVINVFKKMADGKFFCVFTCFSSIECMEKGNLGKIILNVNKFH